MQDKKYEVWLASLPGIGSRRFTALINFFGSAKKVFETDTNALSESKIIHEDIVKTIASSKSLEKIEAYIKKAESLEIKIVTLDGEEYPENLKNIYDPPPVLYIKGKLLKQDEFSLGIVGSRKASEYGLKTAEKLAYELAENGITVISGMALGIDSAAHRGALRAGGRTIAVFGCGLGHIYPKSGLNLSKEIIKSGAIISEYPIGVEPRPENFPARNRIISGMSLGIAVIEAGLKSGTLITTDFALEQGRDVFAVPGNINSPNSKGTNNLIKNGAKLVDCVEDILEELRPNDFSNKENNKSEGYVNNKNVITELNDEELMILNCLKESGRNLDDIINMTKLSSGDVISLTTLLEIKGDITQVEGVFYITRT